MAAAALYCYTQTHEHIGADTPLSMALAEFSSLCTFLTFAYIYTRTTCVEKGISVGARRKCNNLPRVPRRRPPGCFAARSSCYSSTARLARTIARSPPRKRDICIDWQVGAEHFSRTAGEKRRAAHRAVSVRPTFDVFAHAAVCGVRALRIGIGIVYVYIGVRMPRAVGPPVGI